MLVIKCARCGKKAFKYNKIGHGKVLRCYYSRIKKDYSKKDSDKIVCRYCGNIIGIDDGDCIKMNQNEFTYTGTKLNK
ncbi:hypothetical protein [Sporosalibacterium faouarense]|uniref:hypothetical protein n=1 Tax=Sporosalibacterium faouarense TaxID=516123 RepID=UPI00192C8D70|nr:hypothetical protein [Sporosalibacterium faouarense]